jgi:RHS repeat-associated protein
MVIGPKTIHRLTCKFTYGDTYKNLTLITDANTGLTRMSYDLNGNVLTVEDPANRTTTMTFDGKNRMLTTADALSETTTMAYYPNGTLQQVTDALGRVTTFFYTPTSRLAKIHDALGQDTLFHYDGAGNLLSVQDPNLNVTGMVYDAAGKMIQVNQPDTYQVEYVFNAINRLVAITTPNGNLTDAASTNLQGSKNILRNPSMEVDYPYPSNNGARYWEINPASREPVVARSTAQAHSGSKSLYMFESAGVGATSTTFYQNNISTYAGGRYLASVWAAKAADSVTATFTLSAALRDYYSNSQVVAGSDTAGGVVHLDGTSTNWAQSTPLRVDVPGDTQATLFHPPVVYLSINGTYQSSNTPSWLDDAALNSLSTCFEYDGENLREVGSPDGGRTRMEYDEFGIPISSNDPSGLGLLTYVGGAGVRNDTPSGLALMGHRYYDQTLGRFISQDPIGFSGGLNLYQYASGSPLTRIDPSGLWSWPTFNLPPIDPGASAGFSMTMPQKAVEGGLTLGQIGITAGLATGGMGIANAAEAGSWRVWLWMARNPFKAALGVGLAEGSTGHPGIGSPVSSGPCPSRGIVRTLARGETLDEVQNEMKGLAFQNGQEVGLIRLINGPRAIVMGNEVTNITLPLDTQRILGHIHPMDMPMSGPSPDDMDALGALNQFSSWLYEHGVWTRFGRNGPL